MAWTERYVRADAAGGGDGTTDTNSGANGAWTLAEGITNEAAGMRLNVKAGTYANTTTSRTMAAAGTTTQPIWWRGFKTTPGDQDGNNVAVAGTDIPSFTFTTGRILFTGAFHIVSNLDVSATGGTAALFTTGVSGTYYNLRSTSTSAVAGCTAFDINGGPITVIGGTFTATTTATQCVRNGTSARSTLIGCQIIGGAAGLLGTTTATALFACVFSGQAGDSIVLTTGNLVAINCSFYAPSGNGINWTGTPAAACEILNCYFEGVNQASKAAIMNSSGTNTGLIRCTGNGYYNCTANTSGLGDFPLIFDNGTLASAAFVAPGSGDFSVGTVARAIGFPGPFENTAAFRGYLDLGAVQRQEPAGGGGRIFIVEG